MDELPSLFSPEELEDTEQDTGNIRFLRGEARRLQERREALGNPEDRFLGSVRAGLINASAQGVSTRLQRAQAAELTPAQRAELERQRQQEAQADIARLQVRDTSEFTGTVPRDATTRLGSGVNSAITGFQEVGLSLLDRLDGSGSDGVFSGTVEEGRAFVSANRAETQARNLRNASVPLTEAVDEVDSQVAEGNYLGAIKTGLTSPGYLLAVGSETVGQILGSGGGVGGGATTVARTAATQGSRIANFARGVGRRALDWRTAARLAPQAGTQAGNQIAEVRDRTSENLRAQFVEDPDSVRNLPMFQITRETLAKVDGVEPSDELVLEKLSQVAGDTAGKYGFVASLVAMRVGGGDLIERLGANALTRGAAAATTRAQTALQRAGVVAGAGAAGLVTEGVSEGLEGAGQEAASIIAQAELEGESVLASLAENAPQLGEAFRSNATVGAVLGAYFGAGGTIGQLSPSEEAAVDAMHSARADLVTSITGEELGDRPRIGLHEATGHHNWVAEQTSARPIFSNENVALVLEEGADSGETTSYRTVPRRRADRPISEADIRSELIQERLETARAARDEPDFEGVDEQVAEILAEQAGSESELENLRAADIRSELIQERLETARAARDEPDFEGVDEQVVGVLATEGFSEATLNAIISTVAADGALTDRANVRTQERERATPPAAFISERRAALQSEGITVDGLTDDVLLDNFYAELGYSRERIPGIPEDTGAGVTTILTEDGQELTTVDALTPIEDTNPFTSSPGPVDINRAGRELPPLETEVQVTADGEQIVPSRYNLLTEPEQAEATAAAISFVQDYQDAQVRAAEDVESRTQYSQLAQEALLDPDTLNELNSEDFTRFSALGLDAAPAARSAVINGQIHQEEASEQLAIDTFNEEQSQRRFEEETQESIDNGVPLTFDPSQDLPDRLQDLNSAIRGEPQPVIRGSVPFAENLRETPLVREGVVRDPISMTQQQFLTSQDLRSEVVRRLGRWFRTETRPIDFQNPQVWVLQAERLTNSTFAELDPNEASAIARAAASGFVNTIPEGTERLNEVAAAAAQTETRVQEIRRTPGAYETEVLREDSRMLAWHLGVETYAAMRKDMLRTIRVAEQNTDAARTTARLENLAGVRELSANTLILQWLQQRVERAQPASTSGRAPERPPADGAASLADFQNFLQSRGYSAEIASRASLGAIRTAVNQELITPNYLKVGDPRDLRAKADATEVVLYMMGLSERTDLQPESRRASAGHLAQVAPNFVDFNLGETGTQAFPSNEQLAQERRIIRNFINATAQEVTLGDAETGFTRQDYSFFHGSRGGAMTQSRFAKENITEDNRRAVRNALTARVVNLTRDSERASQTARRTTFRMHEDVNSVPEYHVKSRLLENGVAFTNNDSGGTEVHVDLDFFESPDSAVRAVTMARLQNKLTTECQ